MTTTETTQEAGTRYRMKSAETEAVQFTGSNQEAVQAFTHGAASPDLNGAFVLYVRHMGTIYRLEPGDWVVREVDGGGFRRYAPADFADAYEPAAEGGELAKLRNACKHMGSVIVSMSRQMECARIEMAQNGPEKAMQWILNGLPDVDGNPPEMQWDGKESADEWFERTADYARSEAPS